MAAKPTTLGKYRHLSQCSTPDGLFNVLAIDHRDNLLSSLNAAALAPLTPAEFTAFKALVMRYLLPYASAVLSDPEYGFGPGIVNGTIPATVGLLSPLEVTDYSAHPSQRITHMIDGWSVSRIKRIGGSGVKLLLYYHPDAENAARQRDLVESIVAECARYDLPFFLEPITYSRDPSQPLSSRELRQVVIESARTFSALGVDVLKIEFPLNVKETPDESIWREALSELNAACSVPWTLLSAGESYDVFCRQAELACQAGASGVIVGRAVWAEAIALQGTAREQFLATTACERMQQLAAICSHYGTSWHQRILPPPIAGRWYTAISAEF